MSVQKRQNGSPPFAKQHIGQTIPVCTHTESNRTHAESRRKGKESQMNQHKIDIAVSVRDSRNACLKGRLLGPPPVR